MINLVSLSIGGLGIVGRVGSRHLSISCGIHETTTRRGVILTWYLAICRLVSQRRQLWPDTGWIGLVLVRLRLCLGVGVNLVGLGGRSGTLPFFGGLALVLFLLLTGLPLLSDLLEFCSGNKLAVGTRSSSVYIDTRDRR